LHQHPVDGRQANVCMFSQQRLVTVLGAQVAVLGAFEDLHHL